MTEFGPEYDDLMDSAGCVVKSLASIAGAPATRDEYMDRVRQIFKSRITTTLSLNEKLTKEEEDARLEAMVREGEADVLELIGKYQTYTTPMGTALAGLTVHPKLAPISAFERHLDEGDKVAIRIPGHMFHLGKIDGNLVRVSDGNAPLDLPIQPDTFYHGLVFKAMPLPEAT